MTYLLVMSMASKWYNNIYTGTSTNCHFVHDFEHVVSTLTTTRQRSSPLYDCAPLSSFSSSPMFAFQQYFSQTRSKVSWKTPSFHKRTWFHNPTFVKNQITDFENDPIIEENFEKISRPESFHSQKYHDQLLRDLDAAFSYSGRLNSQYNYQDSMDPFRCGFVCIMGAPNMGKSTLLNALIQESLSIISDKPQTTRHSILGILTTNTSQICFYDTPGILDQTSYQLQETMMETVKSSFHDADVLLIVTDAYNTPIPSDELFQKVQLSNKPKLVIINKIDLLQQKQPQTLQQEQQSINGGNVTLSRTSSIEEIIATWRQLTPDAIAILPVSAIRGSNDNGVKLLHHILTNNRKHIMESIRQLGRPIPNMFLPQCYCSVTTSSSGTTSTSEPTITRKIGGLSYATKDLEDSLLNIIPISPPLYDIEAYTDRTERFIASEIIRSILFSSKLLNKEIPYCCEVQVTEFKETSVVIKQQNPPKEKTRQGIDVKARKENANPISTKSKLNQQHQKQKEVLLRISAFIIVERESQKMIVIGKSGQLIKQIGILAREKLQTFFQSKVHLTLNVKVNPDWRKNVKVLKQYGYKD